MAAVARANLWLLVVGASLLALTLVPGEAGFVDLVGWAYTQALPQHHPVFRPDLVAQTRWLHRILMGLGCGALAGYLILLRSHLSLVAWFTGRRGPDPEAALAVALLATITCSCLFVCMRVVRDGLLFGEADGLSMDERRVLLLERHAGEPDYGPARRFRERAAGRGNLAILREGRRGFVSLYYASYLFPIRTYVIRGETCAQAAQLALAAAEPRFDWIDADCRPAFNPLRRDELP